MFVLISKVSMRIEGAHDLGKRLAHSAASASAPSVIAPRSVWHLRHTAIPLMKSVSVVDSFGLGVVCGTYYIYRRAAYRQDELS